MFKCVCGSGGVGARRKLRAFSAGDEEDDAPDEGDAANDRRKRDAVRFFRRHLDGTEVHGFLPGSPRDAAISESDDTDDNEKEREDGF